MDCETCGDGGFTCEGGRSFANSPLEGLELLPEVFPSDELNGALECEDCQNLESRALDARDSILDDPDSDY